MNVMLKFHKAKSAQNATITMASNRFSPERIRYVVRPQTKPSAIV